MISSSSTTAILALLFAWATANLDTCQGFIISTQYDKKGVSRILPPVLRYREGGDLMIETQVDGSISEGLMLKDFRRFSDLTDDWLTMEASLARPQQFKSSSPRHFIDPDLASSKMLIHNRHLIELTVFEFARIRPHQEYGINMVSWTVRFE